MAKMASIILWGGSILAGAALAVQLIYWIHERSLQTPTFLNLESHYYPAFKVTFPSVLLCNANVVYRPAMEKVLRKLYYHNQ